MKRKDYANDHSQCFSRRRNAHPRGFVRCRLRSPSAHALVVYSDTTTFTGFGYANGGSALISNIRTTRLVADDLTFSSNFAGQSVTQFSFPVANLNTVAVKARPRIRFYQDNNGAPGAYITGYSFAAFSIPTGVSTYFTTLAPGSFVIPAAAPGATTETLWAGITYDNSGATTTTAAQMNNLGVGTFDPPTVGSSSASAFSTTAADTGLEDNPVGSSFTLTGAAASFSWELQVADVPEPGAVAMLMGMGVSGAALLRRKTARK